MTVRFAEIPSLEPAPAIPPSIPQVHWHTSIADIDPPTWDRVFGGSQLKSHALHRAVEESELEGIAMRYLVLEEADAIRGIVPCFTYTIDLDVLATEFFRTTMMAVKRKFPTLLSKRIFFAGTPIAICDHLWGVPPGSIEAEAIRAIKLRSRAEKCLITIVKEIPADQKSRFASALARDFFLVESLPNSYLLASPAGQPFPTAFRKKYRTRINASRRKFLESGFTWEVCEDFAQNAEIMERLYLQVLARSSNKFERLNAGFFRAVADRIGGAVFCLFGRAPSGDIVCFELIVEEKDAIVPMYLGIDSTRQDAGDIYFNCIYRIQEEAEKRGKSLVKLGQTSYEAKAYAGAVFERLYLALDAPSTPMRMLLKTFGRTLFPSTALPRTRCFRDEIVTEIEGTLKSQGIAHEGVKTTGEENYEHDR